MFIANKLYKGSTTKTNYCSGIYSSVLDKKT